MLSTGAQLSTSQQRQREKLEPKTWIGIMANCCDHMYMGQTVILQMFPCRLTIPLGQIWTLLAQHKAFPAEVAWAASYFFTASKYFWERLEQSVPESGIRYKLIACNYAKASSIFWGFGSYCYCNSVQFANTIIENYSIDNFSLPIVCDHLNRFLVIFWKGRGF